MSHVPSSSTSRSNLDAIFNVAPKAYRKKTGNDITSHPLATELQSCDSSDAILAVLRRQIPTQDQSQNSDGTFTKYLIPTVNVLYTLSDTLGEGISLVFSPSKVIFTGIGVLLLAVKDINASQGTLVDLFSRIECFFRRLEIYIGVPPTSAMTEIAAEIMAEVLIIIGMVTKEVKRGRMKKYLKKLIGNTDIEDSLQKLDKLTQEEARMASAEQLRIAHSIEGKVMRVDDRVQHVRDDVQDVAKKVEDVNDKVQDAYDEVQVVGRKLDDTNRNLLRDDLLRWLSPSDPSINHNIASKAHHDGTAQWFFEGRIFNEWKSAASFLWVHGKPGSGKSILCSSIIQDIITLNDTGRASMAYFYFDFRDIDKQKLQNLLPSLLIQLSARSDSCCDALSDLYSSHDRGIRKPNDRAMIECLQTMLNFDEQYPTYIILDAIDECPLRSNVGSPRQEVLDFIDELVGLHLSNVHICVTSRPEVDIQAILGPLTSYPVSLHNQSGQKQDIADYVKSFVETDRRMRRWRDEDKDLVIKTLPEKADGMFRWVSCQLEVLRDCFPSSVRRTIGELPDSLDETYERMLMEIRKPNQGHARRMLQCLVAAVRPLRVAELAEVLAVDFSGEGIPILNPGWRWEDHEEAVMSTCSSLVIIVDDKDKGADEDEDETEYSYEDETEDNNEDETKDSNEGENKDSRIVQFSHFSVKEFLTSDRLAESTREVTVSQYHIDLEPAHAILAQACLGVLLRLDDHINRDNIKGFPLARYAAEHWVDHARFEKVSSRIKGEMECLFDADKPHFSAWLWIHNEDRDGRSMSTMSPEKPEAVPLYYAALLGFRDLTTHLLSEHPKDVCTKGGFEVTPLHASAYHGHTDTFSLLIDHFPNLDIRGFLDHTPLHRSSIEGHLEIGQRLLDRGANVNAGDNSNRTPLYMAAAYGRLEFVRMLFDHGAAIDSPDYAGRTPLHYASSNGQVEVVRLLLEHGADPNARTNSGKTPSDYASRKGHRGVVELLSVYCNSTKCIEE